MSRFLSLTALVAIVAVISWGCAGQDTTAPANSTTQTENDADHDTTTIAVSATLCGHCGEAKGSENCCIPTSRCTRARWLATTMNAYRFL